MAVRKEDTPAGAMAKATAPDPVTLNDDAGQAAEAERLDRVAALEAENAELRRQVEKLSTAAALAKPDEPPAKPFRVRVSEGVRGDLVQRGEAVDPGSGLLLKRDPDSGEITAINRATGQPAGVQVII